MKGEAKWAERAIRAKAVQLHGRALEKGQRGVFKE